MPRSQVVIENPILNSPYGEPTLHFRFDDDGITDQIVEGRRPSSYFMPIPKAKRRRAAQQELEYEEWTQDRIEETKFVNDIRGVVSRWRGLGWPGVTPVTRSLLEYWTNPDRERPLFFCQVEALETAIYLTETAQQQGDAWIENQLKEMAADANPGIFRVAHKMATGTGKTVVMAMLIAWQTLNKIANPQDRRFSDTFLVVTPGITIRDRLQVLRPSNSDNYFRERDVVPPDQFEGLGRARIAITNFHAFLPREKVKASRLTKQLAGQREGVFTETPAEVAARVCRDLGLKNAKRGLVVLNDEAHHCYRRRQGDLADAAEAEALKGEERKAAAERDEEARVWISGLEAVNEKYGIKVAYDLSATPFYLRGSGWPEGTLFQWVVSDFSLVDAIEAGLVKIPRVPIDDNTQQVDSQPTYRNLWLKIRDDLPKTGRSKTAADGDRRPVVPGPLEGAIESLYANYEKSFRAWEKAAEGDRLGGSTPPVFIVVCSNTTVSKMVFDHIAGWERTLDDGSTVAVPGALDLFSNVEGDRWLHRPRTILIDSSELDSGDAMSPEFKAAARREITELKAELSERFPGRDPGEISDEDLLREVMNTVGKRGKLGDGIRCVVSVSMLTEGWDANTVTHILGVRAFGTQLLCEQVVGRGLRRRSYALGDDGRFAPEYAEVYGVPFSFIPASGTDPNPKPGPMPKRVRALEGRADAMITFPRVVGYRWEIPDDHLTAHFGPESHMALETRDIPSRTEVAAVVGETEEHHLDRFERMRSQQVAFKLASRLVTRLGEGSGEIDALGRRPWLFKEALGITKDWIRDCVKLKDDAFVGLLAMAQRGEEAVGRIYQAIATSAGGDRRILPVLRSFDPQGSTAFVDFDTTKDVWRTKPELCQVSHVVCDSGWEATVAEKLEHIDAVKSYVKNQGLGFTIPYTIDGRPGQYVPDFIVRLRDGRGVGEDDLLNLIIEVSGEAKRAKGIKVDTARNFWVPAVMNHGGFGRWRFIEVTDPWEAAGMIEAVVANLTPAGVT